MELVTLAHIVFSRIGSASSNVITRHKEEARLAEVADETTQTLREVVIAIATELGEHPNHLKRLVETNNWSFGQQPGAVIFNVQGSNVQYSNPYAICQVYPALKIGNRYFKLEEVKS